MLSSGHLLNIEGDVATWSKFFPLQRAKNLAETERRHLPESGGWRPRREHYRALSQRLRDGLASLGVEMLLEEPETSSAILTSFLQPPGVAYDQLHDRLKEAGFVIYAGQGNFFGEIFRIAVMGEVTLNDIDELLETCRPVLQAGAAAASLDVAGS